MKQTVALLMALAFVVATSVAQAQDPVKVDPKHYKVEFENDQVRVLHIKYAPGEKSVMHEHPDGVAVFLTDQTVKFNYPDGKSEDMSSKAGESRWTKGGAHQPENVGGTQVEVILVELKTK